MMDGSALAMGVGVVGMDMDGKKLDTDIDIRLDD
jgi:hypothetical protein